LRQEIKLLSEKYEAEVTKNRTLVRDLEAERQRSQRLEKTMEEMRAKLDAALRAKLEAETSWRSEKERFERTITELKAIIATHGSGSGTPCDPQVWERKFRKALEEIRQDYNRKLEEFKKKYDELRKNEVSGKVRELEEQVRELRSELTRVQPELQRLKESNRQLEREKAALERLVEELRIGGNSDELKRENEALKIRLREQEAKVQTLIDRYGSRLERRAHLQTGLKTYERLVTVEETR
jgi:chromosome segregation ATPase